MKPIYLPKSFPHISCERLREELVWETQAGNREECWMDNSLRPYTYGNPEHARTYKANMMFPIVREIMLSINLSSGNFFDVCMANYYRDYRDHLGWHADDSPEMDHNYPIAVVSFGATRELWTRLNGAIDRDVYTLEHGSVFFMPVGMQQTHQHRIPKCSRQDCGPRLSLTFRKFL